MAGVWRLPFCIFNMSPLIVFCRLCYRVWVIVLDLHDDNIMSTTLTVWDLWTDPVGVAALLDVWGGKLGGPRAGV